MEKNQVMTAIAVLVVLVVVFKWGRGVKFNSDDWCEPMCEKQYPGDKTLSNACTDSCSDSLEQLMTRNGCRKTICRQKYPQRGPVRTACYYGCKY